MSFAFFLVLLKVGITLNNFLDLFSYSLKLCILEYYEKQRLLSVTEFISWLPFCNFSLFLVPNHK